MLAGASLTPEPHVSELWGTHNVIDSLFYYYFLMLPTLTVCAESLALKRSLEKHFMCSFFFSAFLKNFKFMRQGSSKDVALKNQNTAFCS